LSLGEAAAPPAAARPAKILVAGDRFVRTHLLLDALDREGVNLAAVTRHEFAWPVEPFGDVAEVREAAGDEETVAGLVRDVEVVVTEMAAMTARVIAAAPGLRLIVVCRGGPINVNLDAATARGIPVCFSPGRNAAATAEYTVGLMLSALRQIPFAHADLARGVWRGDFYQYDSAGSELEGKVVGLVGFGAVGARVARVMVAFGARVLVADPYVDAAAVTAVGAEKVELAALLPRASVLSLHARLTAETRHIVGRAEIAALPAGAVVVNGARGGLLDYAALCDALDEGHLRGAALDVYDPEPPPPGDRVYTTPRLVLSPHIAGASRETAERAAAVAAAEVARHVRGEPLVYVANPAALG